MEWILFIAAFILFSFSICFVSDFNMSLFLILISMLLFYIAWSLDDI